MTAACRSADADGEALGRGARGLLLVVSSPSGAGKTTLCRRLVREHRDLSFSVSYTTRAPRAGEQDGVDYHFVGEEEFDGMIRRGAFSEWAHVHGRRYGTAVRTVREALDRAGHVLFDVDYQGAERLLSQFPTEARLVYILPPSMEALERRLRSRGTDADLVIERRLRKAAEELLHYGSYHYLVLNDDIERAYGELDAIYRVERMRLSARDRAPGEGPGAPLPLEDAAALEVAQACVLSRRTGLAEALVAQAAVRP